MSVFSPRCWISLKIQANQFSSVVHLQILVSFSFSLSFIYTLERETAKTEYLVNLQVIRIETKLHGSVELF